MGGHRVDELLNQDVTSCGDACIAEPLCVGFSVNTVQGDAHEGKCFLCDTITGDDHNGFDFYMMTASQGWPQ